MRYRPGHSPCHMNIGGGEMQFRVAVDEFLRFCTIERQLSQHTLQAYTADLADFRKWLPLDVPITEVSEVTLKNYLSDLVGQRKLAAATVRRRFACLRAFFRRLVELGQLSDPFGNWRLQLPRRKRLPRTLSRPEISSLLAPLRRTEALEHNEVGDLLPTAIRLMVSTGIRVGELCKLRIEDISPDGASFRVHGKGSRDRVAYISDVTLQRELKEVTRCRRHAGAACGALFLNRYGSQVRPQSIRSKLRRYAGEVGLARRVTPHMLRHTAATLLIETGVDIRFVQRMLGHSSISTTEIYTHVSDEALRVTLERADVLGMLARP
jgi:site-specific recombinase XerD